MFDLDKHIEENAELIVRSSIKMVEEEINRRLFTALADAGRSPLGLPGTVDTFKDMLTRAGLALVLLRGHP